jgi:hypothetical protein
MRLYIACITLLFSLSPMVRADDTENNRRTLRGLKGMEAFVASLQPEVEQTGLTKSAIQTDVESKLRQAGILVLDPKLGHTADCKVA